MTRSLTSDSRMRSATVSILIGTPASIARASLRMRSTIDDGRPSGPHFREQIPIEALLRDRKIRDAARRFLQRLVLGILHEADDLQVPPALASADADRRVRSDPRSGRTGAPATR